MRIFYLGHSCFKIVLDNGLTVLTDPYTRIGYELPENLSADIVTVSHGHFDHNFVQAVKNRPVVIASPGTYEFEGLTIRSIETAHDAQNGALRGKNVVYLFEVHSENVTFGHLGDIGEPLSEKLIKSLKGISILMIPVGGTYTIDAQQAKAYISGIRPETVLPMHYRLAESTLDIDSIEKFTELYRGENSVRITKNSEFVYKKNDRTEKKTEIVVLERLKKI